MLASPPVEFKAGLGNMDEKLHCKTGKRPPRKREILKAIKEKQTGVKEIFPKPGESNKSFKRRVNEEVQSHIRKVKDAKRRRRQAKVKDLQKDGSSSDGSPEPVPEGTSIRDLKRKILYKKKVGNKDKEKKPKPSKPGISPRVVFDEFGDKFIDFRSEKERREDTGAPETFPLPPQLEEN
ncbi:hypothetical protein AAMO2058_001406500 [Amorphochlora amoebiformis]